MAALLDDRLEELRGVDLGAGIPVVDLRASSPASQGPALAAALRGCGAVQLLVPSALEARNRRALGSFVEFLGQPESAKARFAIAEGESSNGYHAAGAAHVGAYYNAHRDGVIFEDDELLPLAGGDFLDAVAGWRDACRGLAAEVLAAVAVEVGAPRYAFEAGGPFDVTRGGQFHVKRTLRGGGGDAVLLPPHRDPSLISLVTHVAREAVARGGAGLEIHDGAAYRAVAFTGFGVATVIAGSLLASVLPGVVSPKHRVVADDDAFRDGADPRVAATFFFQPRDDARIADAADPAAQRAAPTYAAWKQRAYARYFKATQSRLKKKQAHNTGAAPTTAAATAPAAAVGCLVHNHGA